MSRHSKPSRDGLPGEPVRVLIVDDHHIVRYGLRALLEEHRQIRVVGEAATGREALSIVETMKPNVVLLDLRLPDIDGLDVCRQIKSKTPSPAVLFLTSFADDRTVLGAIESGADGYLLKQVAGQDIPSLILTVARGGSVLDPLVTRRVLRAVQRPGLPGVGATPVNRLEILAPQEMRVLELVALGNSNKQIAALLQLSEGTVRNYLSAVFDKLRVESRVQAAALWLRHQVPAAGDPTQPPC
jgi:two-component system, NarL family, response regulator DevR